MTAAPESVDRTALVVGAEAAGIWGDETEIATAAVALAARRISRHSDPKTTARPASELAAAAGPTITRGGLGGAEVLRIFEDILAPATRAQDDPMNLAYIPAAPTRAALAFDAVVSTFNIYGGAWEAGAGAIFAENEALAWLVELLGWPATAGGCFVSGGTTGNLSALVAARQTLRRRRGRHPAGQWQLACTAQAHSSVQAAASVLDAEVVSVPEAADGRLTGDALRAALRDAPDVFAVVASAGTTNAGIVDDLDLGGRRLRGVRRLAARRRRVRGSGARGAERPARCSPASSGPTVSSSTRTSGCSPRTTAVPWSTAQPELARAAHAQHASYLDAVDREIWNPWDLAAHLSRRCRGLPFWFSLAVHGTDRYTAAIEHTLDTARAVADGMAKIPQLKLILPPTLSVILFERPGWSESDYHEWSSALSHEGVILCIPTRWQGRTVLRLAFVNPATDPDHVLEVLRTTTG